MPPTISIFLVGKMAIRKKSTIISYFTKSVAQTLEAADNISYNEEAEEEVLQEENNRLTEGTNGSTEGSVLTLQMEKRTNPGFYEVPIQIK